MRTEHINITIPLELKMRVDAESKREHIGRSTLIQRAVSFYLDAVKRKKMRELLVEGYSEMAQEARDITKEFAEIDDEAFRHDN